MARDAAQRAGPPSAGTVRRPRCALRCCWTLLLLRPSHLHPLDHRLPALEASSGHNMSDLLHLLRLALGELAHGRFPHNDILKPLISKVGAAERSQSSPFFAICPFPA